MTIKPILFSGPMVRALLEGRKTQTRRVLKPPFGCRVVDFAEAEPMHFGGLSETDPRRWGDMHAMEGFPLTLCDMAMSYFECGDLLWVREDWKARSAYDDLKPSEMSGDEAVLYLADNTRWNNAGRADNPWGRRRWSQHMPRWASRITLRVTEVRVQRLQEISTDDALAEGIERKWAPGVSSLALMAQGIAKAEFRELWQSLNEKRGFGWDVNPWVTAISFEVIRANVDSIKEQTNDD